jgi:hypothetical protein
MFKILNEFCRNVQRLARIGRERDIDPTSDLRTVNCVYPAVFREESQAVRRASSGTVLVKVTQ